MPIVIGPGITIGPGISLATLPSYATSGLIAYVDAGVSASYSGTGTTWTDISGTGNNFTLAGTTPWTGAGVQSYFTFSSGYATSSAILPAAAYTKVAVFQISGAYGNIISGGLTGTDHAFWGASQQYLQSGHNSAWSTVVSPVLTPANQWVFGAVSFDNTNGWRLYMNSQSVVTAASAGTFSPTPAIVELGGFQGAGNYLNGQLAAAMIYNRVLSDTEIAQNYNYFKSRFTSMA